MKIKRIEKPALLADFETLAPIIGARTVLHTQYGQNAYEVGTRLIEKRVIEVLEMCSEVPKEYRKKSKSDTYGLPYTSCSGYGALWVTNCPAKLMSSNPGWNVDGVAISHDWELVVIATRDTDNGEEMGYFLVYGDDYDETYSSPQKIALKRIGD